MTLDDEILGLYEVTLAIEGDGAGDSVIGLDRANGLGDGFPGRDGATGCLGSGLYGDQRECGTVIGLGRERLGLGTESGLEVLDELGSSGICGSRGRILLR